MARIVEDASFERARNHIATLALSMYQIHGLPAPSSDELGSVVTRAEASMSLHQLRHPESISASAIGQIDQFVLSVADVKRRPTNLYSADAARAGQVSGSGWDGTKRSHADPQNLSLSSARYREMGGSSDGRQGGAGPIAGARVEGVPVEFVRSFSGSGVGGEALRSFAAVGLDRGTFEQFRHEGYSAAQIADNARDMKVLGFHGGDEAKIAQHAPTDLRKAAVDVEKAKTPEQKAKAKAIEADKARHYEVLPDSDPRKARARDFIKALEQHGHHIDLKQGPAARANQGDNALHAEHAKIGPVIGKAEDHNLAAAKKQSVASLGSVLN